MAFRREAPSQSAFRGAHMERAGAHAIRHEDSRTGTVNAARQNDRKGPRVAAENLSLALILNLVRQGEATTRQEIERQSGLGRAIVTDRLAKLMDLELLEEGELGPSTGGRDPAGRDRRLDAWRRMRGSVGPSARRTL